MSAAILALAAIGLSVAAQFMLKAGMSSPYVMAALHRPFDLQMPVRILTNGFVLGGLVLYGTGALAWLGVLARWDVSKAYPLVGLGFALTALIGVLFGEHVTALRVTGIALICAGVFLVAKS